MLSHLLAVGRLFLVCVWTMIVILVCLPGLLVLPFNRALFARLASHVVHVWALVLVRVLGVRLDTHGTPPARGTFATSNHLSHLDILVLAAIYKTSFIAKAEISGWPIIGFMARLGATLWVNRERARDTVRLREELDYLLRRGVTITMFAEGTSGDGSSLLPFKPPLFETPAALQTHCVPVAIHYATPGAGPGPAGPDGGDPARTVCWWGDMTFVSHYWNLMRLKRIVATVKFGEPVSGIQDRKALAAECERRVAAMFTPIPR